MMVNGIYGSTIDTLCQMLENAQEEVSAQRVFYTGVERSKLDQVILHLSDCKDAFKNFSVLFSQDSPSLGEALAAYPAQPVEFRAYVSKWGNSAVWTACAVLSQAHTFVESWRRQPVINGT